ncbi:hypothetical protein ACGFK1_11495 [Mycobacterium sp. NPDC048908]|uniref:hypothetical protein n=1 Tax=Mycobacterium sp. NPDC048908 TaxID=3364292 RepID=UPI0037149A75
MAKHAQAPLGSAYHYFPGRQVPTGRRSGAVGRRPDHPRVGQAVAGRSAGRAPGFSESVAENRGGQDFRVGCPVLAASIEGPTGRRNGAA